MMEQQKIKLGARVLTEQEMNLILPNSNQVYDQIDVFRSNISEGSGSEQKTNNIGIMGCRGAGKTSILKTFYKRVRRAKKYGRYFASDCYSGEYVSGDVAYGCDSGNV